MQEFADPELAKREEQRIKDERNEAIRAYSASPPVRYEDISTPAPDYLLPRNTRRVVGYRQGDAGSHVCMPIYADD